MVYLLWVQDVSSSLSFFVVLLGRRWWEFGNPGWFSRKTPEAPDGHRRVKNHGRPQDHADWLQMEAGRTEDNHRAEVIRRHRRDHPFRGAARRVAAREPAGGAQREQRDPGEATECHRRGRIGR
jgi:hypothetical protein